MSLAILGDDRSTWRPTTYRRGRWGFQVFAFLDWLMELPPPLKQEFKAELQQYEQILKSRSNLLKSAQKQDPQIIRGGVVQAMAKQSKGTCTYCQKSFAKGGMVKHLSTCTSRQAAIAAAAKGKGTAENLFHLRVESLDNSAYWLDLEVRGTKTLKDIDTYLRGIWLECCGHLSEFNIGSFGNTIGKQRKVEEVFQCKDTKVAHSYDMGTTSETLVRVMDGRKGQPLSSKALVLMARNQAPEYLCIKCSKPAAFLCNECLYEEGTEGTLCAAHAKKHPHHNYGDPMPLLNSPRSGMCGYDGPADPPY